MAVADELGSIWDARWADATPVTHQLKWDESLLPRWVRFHSLPGSKRYADGPDEVGEILRRHNVVLAELGLTDRCFVSTTWYSPDDVSGLWEERAPELHPGSTRWRSVVHDGSEYFLHASVEDYPSVDVDELLRKRAEEELSGMMILPVDGRWIYSPYDGGADLFAASPKQRDDLAARHRNWLPAHPSGL